MRITDFAALINAYAEANPNLLVVNCDEYGDAMSLSSVHLVLHKDNEVKDGDDYDNFNRHGVFNSCFQQEFTPEMSKDYLGLSFSWVMI